MAIPSLWLPLLRRRSSSPTPTLPPNLIAAIVARFDGDSSLASIVGGLYLGIRPPAKSLPGASLYQIVTRPKFTSAPSYYEYVDLQFSIFTEDADEAASLGDAVSAIFDSRSLSLRFANGYLMGMRRTGGNLSRFDGGKSQAGGQCVYQQTLRYRATVGRFIA